MPINAKRMRIVQQPEKLIAVAVVLVLIVGPVLLGLAGLIASRRVPAKAAGSSPVPWNWRLMASSALLYTLAFNLTFFIQELFLVLPKAFTPGLRPTLFHNDHTWEGLNPLASLFQGTGALATFLSAIACALFLRRGQPRSSTLRLFLFWMTYNGFFQSLPQVIIGAVEPDNDVGMAMDFLYFDATAKAVAALAALAAIPLIGLRLRRLLLSLAKEPASVASARARARYVSQVATLPALAGILLIIPFRVPRDWIEVVMVPVVVTIVGIAWLQAGAWGVRAVKTGDSGFGAPSIAYPLGAVLTLLAVFQLVLRPGIHFY
jgi:hypothetical protein